MTLRPIVFPRIRIVDDPVRMAEGKLRLTVENLKDERELTLFLNSEVIPRIESAGRKYYPVYRSTRKNLSQIEIPLSQLKDLYKPFCRRIPETILNDR